jgi:hypothetical protein
VNSPDGPDADFERRCREADLRLRERETTLKEQNSAQEWALKGRELDAKATDQRWARWTNPLVLAVFAAALAALGNAGLTYFNGEEQRKLELTRSNEQIKLEREKVQGQQFIEETKAETARILEVIKTADPEKAAANLEFLLKAGLITDEKRKAALKTFLDQRQPGEGPNIPPAGAAIPSNRPNYNLPVPPENPSQTKAAQGLLRLAVAEINKNVDEDLAADRISLYLRSAWGMAGNVHSVAWSSAFLSWLIQESGHKDGLPNTATGLTIWNDATRKKLTFLPNEKPVLPGDIVFFSRERLLENTDQRLAAMRSGTMSFVPTHPGVVYSSDGDKFSTIEGNVNNAIRLRDHSLSERIIGFIRLSDG